MRLLISGSVNLKIDSEECGVCLDCIDVCPNEAIEKIAYTIKIHENLCDDCEECMLVCPTGAIYNEKDE